MNQGWIYRDRVDASADQQMVLDYYTERYRHSSQADWQQRILAGQILLEGQPVLPETRLKRGQHLAYHRPPWQEPVVPLAFTVLYEDADLLVVNKPSGLPVLPGAGFLEHTLLGQLQQRYPQDTPVPIHRLGRGTSGLVLLARSPAARARLSQQMRAHRIRKVYRAIAQGTTMSDRLTITHPIGKVPHPELGYLYAATPTGSWAYSECQVLRRDAKTTLVEVTILTGRPHQIRIHLAAVGYPLLGDPLYVAGGSFCQDPHRSEEVPVPGDCGYWLHAYQLQLAHPITGQALNLNCPLPEQLR